VSTPMKAEIAAARGQALVALVAVASLASPAFLAAQEAQGVAGGSRRVRGR